jgi:hypothetical protein
MDELLVVIAIFVPFPVEMQSLYWTSSCLLRAALLTSPSSLVCPTTVIRSLRMRSNYIVSADKSPPPSVSYASAKL